MQLSPRITALEESIRKISEAAAKISGCVRFDIGQPDFKTPQHIQDAAIRAIREKPMGYAPMVGIPELRRAIADYENKKGLNLAPENIMVTNGGNGSLFCTFLAIIEKDDEVLIADPAWPPYEMIVRSVGGVPVYTKFFEGGESSKASSGATAKRDDFDGKKLLADSIESAITSKSKAIIVNSPENPTGRVASESDLKTIAEIAIEHGIMIISDEVYDKLLFGGAKHYSIAKFAPENTILINSTSKTYSMTGWRLGWLAAPKDIIKELAKCNRVTTASVSAVVQYAALAALTESQECVQDMCHEYEKRCDTTVKRMKQLNWDFINPEGAFYAFPKIPGCIDSWKLAMELLEKAKVALVPGVSFGPSGEGHVRICYGSVNSECINEGFDRIEKYMNIVNKCKY
ncbi:MAG: pyridoxal phosphate-dependent aminotransferase [Nanoarchaeota archaeon]|nr:pyridoxal phosphate-dependent aminotransferase [Nanoarchaeota archaeon]MBU4300284.1 pyridoxal phosphate-dependent aminotransferase [Nanoarchaeota archaeon]MBU4452503.1 pyridoxal phosphate-dependent aminotransferase [Nanoarchaeota archaeon]MCG2723208.1 pyridoxal phosphate-dependent aminotransferase [archaeon]